MLIEDPEPPVVPIKAVIADSKLSILSSSRAMRVSDTSAGFVEVLRLRTDSDASHLFPRRTHLGNNELNVKYHQVFYINNLSQLSPFAVRTHRHFAL